MTSDKAVFHCIDLDGVGGCCGNDRVVMSCLLVAQNVRDRSKCPICQRGYLLTNLEFRKLKKRKNKKTKQNKTVTM